MQQAKRTDADRRARQADRLARIMKLLELIQSERPGNAKRLALEQECDERTVHRDLKVLEMMGVPWYFDKTDRSYRLRNDFRFPVFKLSDEELLEQFTATAIASAKNVGAGTGAKSATRKIAASAGQQTKDMLADAERMIEVLGLQIADHSQHQDVIRTVQRALLERKQVLGQYQSPYENAKRELRMHPYRLALVKQAWYLIGRATEEPSPKTYRIHRFKSLRMLDAKADVPDDFDLKSYFGNAWAVYRGDKSYDVKLLFDCESAAIAAETSWHSTQKVQKQKDGSSVFTFKVDGLEEIANWILGWSGSVRVVRPSDLRKLVVDKLERALKLNGQ